MMKKLYKVCAYNPKRNKQKKKKNVADEKT